MPSNSIGWVDKGTTHITTSCRGHSAHPLPMAYNTLIPSFLNFNFSLTPLFNIIPANTSPKPNHSPRHRPTLITGGGPATVTTRGSQANTVWKHKAIAFSDELFKSFDISGDRPSCLQENHITQFGPYMPLDPCGLSKGCCRLATVGYLPYIYAPIFSLPSGIKSNLPLAR